MRKDLDCKLFCSNFKRHNVSHYSSYYLATDNIHIVLENDNTVLIKGLKKVVNVKFSRNTHLIETSYDRLKSEEITFQQYRENLAKAGVFRWVTNIHEHKRYYYTPSHYYLLRAFRTPRDLSLRHNVRFLPCQHRNVGMTQYVSCNPMVSFHYWTLPAEKFPVRAVDIVNPGIQWRFITPDDTLININNEISTHCLGFVNFLHIQVRTSKSIGNNTWKNATRFILALLITGCAQQTFTVQNKPAVAPKTITHHFFVSGIGPERKLSMQPKFVARRRYC